MPLKALSRGLFDSAAMYGVACCLAGLTCLPCLAEDITVLFHEARSSLINYHGPGREDQCPDNLEEIKIGYFGPFDIEHEEAGDLWQAAQMAIDDLNRGRAGLQPFRLIPGWSENPWGTGIKTVTDMVYRENVWAIIGSIDGPSTHLAEQVVAKARLTLVNPGSTDKTINLANVPWMFSCLPGEHVFVPEMVRSFLDNTRNKSYIVISGLDHDSRVLASELLSELGRRGSSPRFHFNYSAAAREPFSFLNLVDPIEAVIVVASPGESASIVREVKPRTVGPIYGGPSFGRRSFLVKTGVLAEGLRFPLPGVSISDDIFARRFYEETGHPPDFAARQTYDSVKLLADAIDQAGLNRVRIRDAIRALSPWEGINGPITWDGLGRNNRPAIMHEVINGQPRPVSKAVQ